MKETAPVPVKFHLNLEPPNDGGAAVEVIIKGNVHEYLKCGIKKLCLKWFNKYAKLNIIKEELSFQEYSKIHKKQSSFICIVFFNTVM